MKKLVKSRPVKFADHIIKPRTVLLSDFMIRQFLEMSNKYGRNKNNQTRTSHAIQVASLKLAEKKGINTKLLYPNINQDVSISYCT